MFFGGLPPGFEDAFGGGGMPGGGGGGRRRGPVENSKLYEVLGVEKSATTSEISKAYKKMAAKHHPDKGGDEEFFKQIQQAKDVLTDDNKRQLYNQGGLEAVEQGGGGGGGADIFDVLGGRGRRQQQSRVKKGENMVHPLKVTLEQIFKGSARTLRLTRKVIDKQKGVEQCASCGGRGAKIQTIRMGPMIQQVQKTCDECGGSGMMYRQVKVQETLEVHIPKGAPDGTPLLLSPLLLSLTRAHSSPAPPPPPAATMPPSVPPCLRATSPLTLPPTSLRLQATRFTSPKRPTRSPTGRPAMWSSCCRSSRTPITSARATTSSSRRQSR